MKRFVAFGLMLLTLMCAFSGCTKQIIKNTYLVDDPEADLTTTSYYTPPPTTTTSWYVPPPSHYVPPSTSRIPYERLSQVIMTGWGENNPEPQKTSSTYKQEVRLLEDIQKRYNFKFSFKCVDDKNAYYNEFAGASMAGLKYGDIVSLPGDIGFPSAALNGYARCLDGVFDFDDDTIFVDRYTNDALLIKGKHYYMVRPIDYGKAKISGIAFNNKLFKKFKVDTPHDYIKKNTWTLNNFKEVCKQMTRTENNTQYYGFIGNGVMLDSVSITPVTRTGEGQYKFNLDNERVISAINFGKELYDLQFSPKENGEALFSDGKVAMKLGICSPFDLGEGISYAYFPTDNKNSEYTITSTNMPLYILPSTVKDSQVEFLKYIFKEWSMPQAWTKTVEQVLESQFSDEYSLFLAIDALTSLSCEDEWSVYYPFIEQNVLSTDYGISAGISPQEFIDSIKEQAQQDIDKIWEKYDEFK